MVGGDGRRAGSVVAQARKGWPYSRTTAYRLIKVKMKKAGITGVKWMPKGLRHSFAISCNVPLTIVKKWLDHARLETTSIYLDVSGAEERELAQKLWKRVLATTNGDRG